MKIAVIGAGPIGLEAALDAARNGYDVQVHEAGRVGEHLRRFGGVALFTPFGMNSTPEGRASLRAAGAALPAEEAIVTAGELAERYLAPLARLPELRGAVRENERVTHVGREGLGKGDGAGAAARAERRFLLRIETRCGVRFDTADLVIDASGVYGHPRATGPGGLPADGEDRLGDAIERHLPDGDAWARRYAGGATLLVGGGHSAAHALLAFDALARGGAMPQVHWIHRHEPPALRAIEGDPLPARLDLARRAKAAASAARWLTRHPDAVIRRYERGDDRVEVTLENGRTLAVDRVLALVGYQPDLAMTRELQIHLCYASEGPMTLAAAILGAAGGADGDCLAQVAHGPESLRNPEPGFYVLGAKSYGRNAQFLLAIGHRQVKDALQLIEAERGIASPSPAR